MNNFNAVAVIFSGGKSSRMKRDKALLSFGSKSSLAEFQYERLSKIFSKVYLSAKHNKFDFECRLIEDKYEESSPLVALVSVFESLEVDEVFVLSVDAPFVDEEIISKLYAEAKNEADVIVAVSEFGVEPLCAIYRRSILPRAKEFLEENNHKLKFLLKAVRTEEVFVEDSKSFMNLNFPHEYEEAKKLL